MAKEQSKFGDFLKTKSGQNSISRLLCALSFPFATYLALDIGTAEALGVYLGAYVLGYIGGKVGDSLQK